MINLPPVETACIALAVEHETSGRLSEGAIHVAEVIINRTKAKSYPNTPCEVIYQKKQFTNIKPKPISAASWDATNKAIEGYSLGTANTTIIAFHSLKKTPSSWKNLVFKFRIGNHHFYAKEHQ